MASVGALADEEANRPGAVRGPCTSSRGLADQELPRDLPPILDERGDLPRDGADTFWLKHGGAAAHRFRPIFDEHERVGQRVCSTSYSAFAALQPSSQPYPGNWLYLATSEPFCALVCGVQGAGKSHSTNRIVESCMRPLPEEAVGASPDTGVRKLASPMATLVCHFDQANVAVCEAAGVTCAETLVLVSPTAWAERRDRYAQLAPHATVRPLLFDFTKLGVVELEKLMATGNNTQQLYMAVLRGVLRRFAKSAGDKLRDGVFSFARFKAEIENDERWTASQSGPLQQRLDMLEAFLHDSPENSGLHQEYEPVEQVFRLGRFVICDLTDPLLDKTDANRIFQVLVRLFERADIPRGGKLVAFDEAHKYLAEADKGDLCEDVLRLVREMRHFGIRVVVATQCPTVLNSELLELSSFVLLHRFHSPRWFRHLQQHLPLPDDAQEQVQRLNTGEAVLYCPQSDFTTGPAAARLAPNVYRVLVRKPDPTSSDFGASVRHGPDPGDGDGASSTKGNTSLGNVIRGDLPQQLPPPPPPPPPQFAPAAKASPARAPAGGRGARKASRTEQLLKRLLADHPDGVRGAHLSALFLDKFGEPLARPDGHATLKSWLQTLPDVSITIHPGTDMVVCLRRR